MLHQMLFCATLWVKHSYLARCQTLSAEHSSKRERELLRCFSRPTSLITYTGRHRSYLGDIKTVCQHQYTHNCVPTAGSRAASHVPTQLWSSGKPLHLARRFSVAGADCSSTQVPAQLEAHGGSQRPEAGEHAAHWAGPCYC